VARREGVIRNEQAMPARRSSPKRISATSCSGPSSARPNVNSALSSVRAVRSLRIRELQIRDKVLTDRTGGGYLTGSIVNAECAGGHDDCPEPVECIRSHAAAIASSLTTVRKIDARRAKSHGAIGLQSLHPEDPAGAFVEFRISGSAAEVTLGGYDARIPSAGGRGVSARDVGIQRVRAGACTDSAGAANPAAVAGRAPGATGDAAEDVPTLTIYMPPSTTGPMTAVIVAPGGGYRNLSMNKEGRIPANYLNSLGGAAFVRVPARTSHRPIELGDMQRAIRTARARPNGIAPDRISVMGFSAGSHLASTASLISIAGMRRQPTRSIA
jgi:hypothetical protein